MKSVLREILTIFPKHCYAFAYGSAVFKQSPNVSSINKEKIKSEKKSMLPVKVNSTNKMIDLIIVVNDTLNWHQENLMMNNSHYSFLKFFGPKAITKIQENFGANIYFNTLIPYKNETLIKYGVINKNHFINDLLDWDHLYVSGRLQKPVQVITFEHSKVSFKNFR